MGFLRILKRVITLKMHVDAAWFYFLFLSVFVTSQDSWIAEFLCLSSFKIHLDKPKTLNRFLLAGHQPDQSASRGGSYGRGFTRK